MFEVQELDTTTEFDEKLWLTIIDTVTIHADGRMTFKFQGGTEIEASGPTKMKRPQVSTPAVYCCPHG